MPIATRESSLPGRSITQHLKLDQKKIDFAKRYFGVQSEQEAIDRALSLLVEERQLVAGMGP
ncbi:MAG: hypothetical protein Q7J56_00455, partial [Deltaproteobacteria bacterium]|nr:hypothetical protein [Deltaproteobacteria bacterium]